MEDHQQDGDAREPVIAKPAIRFSHAGILRIAAITCSAVISRVHSNCRGVSAWRGHHRKSLWSKRCRTSFQQLLQACQLITRYGVANSLVGWVKPLISTTGVPAAQASQDSPLLSPTNAAACRSQRARSASGRSPVSSSTPCGMWFHTRPVPCTGFWSMQITR